MVNQSRLVMGSLKCGINNQRRGRNLGCHKKIFLSGANQEEEGSHSSTCSSWTAPQRQTSKRSTKWHWRNVLTLCADFATSEWKEGLCLGSSDENRSKHSEALVESLRKPPSGIRDNQLKVNAAFTCRKVRTDGGPCFVIYRATARTLLLKSSLVSRMRISTLPSTPCPLTRLMP